nr:uncharacterized protein LOC109738454 [Aegilops tauschii subsp. strangulata]
MDEPVDLIHPGSGDGGGDSGEGGAEPWRRGPDPAAYHPDPDTAGERDTGVDEAEAPGARRRGAGRRGHGSGGIGVVWVQGTAGRAVEEARSGGVDEEAAQGGDGERDERAAVDQALGHRAAWSGLDRPRVGLIRAARAAAVGAARGQVARCGWLRAAALGGDKWQRWSGSARKTGHGGGWRLGKARVNLDLGGGGV